MAYRNTIAKEQNDRLADQRFLNLFEFAQKINPSLASEFRDAYVRLRTMQEELLRVQQRMASQIYQQGLTPQRLAFPPPPQGTQVCSLTQQREEEGGEEDEEDDEDEEDEEKGDDEAYEYTAKNLLYYGMHDEEINLDLIK